MISGMFFVKKVESFEKRYIFSILEKLSGK